MEYIEFAETYILSSSHNYVLTTELPLKWSCQAVYPIEGNMSLKFALINSDPGIDRRTTVTTAQFANHPYKCTFNFNHYNKENVFELNTHYELRINLTVTVHIPKISVTALAGYDFTKNNTENDMVLVVKGKQFHINKAVLSAYSPFFNNLFNNENFEESKKDEIELKEVDPKEFEVLLQVIYPTNIIVNVDNVQFLWKLADRFEIVIVAKLCENFLCNMEGKQYGQFSINNRMKIAELYNSQKLKDVLYKQMEDLKM